MPFLSIIIPAYNEAERIPKTLEKVQLYVQGLDFEVEVLVVDDGSSDQTSEVVRALCKDFPQLKLVSYEKNRGKGGAVKEGMRVSSGEYRLFMDADYSTPVNEFEKLRPFLGKYDVLIGSRYLNSASIKIKQPWTRQVISRLGNLLIQLLALPGFIDTQCGFKLFSVHAAEKVFPLQTLERWSFDIELLVIAKKQGLTIKEVAVDWYDAEGSKLRATKAAWRTLKDLVTIRKNILTGRYRGGL